MTEATELKQDISILNNKVVILVTKNNITWYKIIKAFDVKHIYLKELQTINFKNITFCTCRHANTNKHIKVSINMIMNKYMPVVSENDLFFVK